VITSRTAAPSPTRVRSRFPSLRLIFLYLTSRKVLACLLLLVASGIVMRVALHAAPGAWELPIAIETCAAGIIGVTTSSPFGEPERVTGRWLPLLRLGSTVALTAVAFGSLAAGSASTHLTEGTLGLLRDTAGFIGIALLIAALLGGSMAWIGPAVYLVLTIRAIQSAWTIPWIWPARPGGDRGAAICAALVFAAGIAITLMRGGRDHAQE
jgi:hypothetical protein